MQAWQVTEIGTHAQLTVAPAPSPAKGEVLVKVAACGLNFADLLMQQGKYQERPPLPYTPGMELSGTVVALGPETSGPPPGSRVAGFVGYGGLAELAVLPVDRLVVLPDGVGFDQAAAFQIAYGTSHLAVDHKARLQAGETLLVLGAAGGVGLTAAIPQDLPEARRAGDLVGAGPVHGHVTVTFEQAHESADLVQHHPLLGAGEQREDPVRQWVLPVAQILRCPTHRVEGA